MAVRKLKCPSCGSEDEFKANQGLLVEVIVDDDLDFLRDPEDSLEKSICSSGAPFGPYKCLKCGTVFDE